MWSLICFLPKYSDQIFELGHDSVIKAIDLKYDLSFKSKTASNKVLVFRAICPNLLMVFECLIHTNPTNQTNPTRGSCCLTSFTATSYYLRTPPTNQLWKLERKYNSDVSQSPDISWPRTGACGQQFILCKVWPATTCRIVKLADLGWVELVD